MRIAAPLFLTFAVCTSLILVQSSFGQEAPSDIVEFNRDIRPILAENCYTCHGPDQNKREAELRLDLEEGALAKRDSGAAIVPGQPNNSELLKRILSQDPDERMPPGSTGKTISPAQIKLIRKWIEQGAKWQQHWSFIAPKKVEPPRVKQEAWIRNPIDRFIAARLTAAGLQPAADADRRTLARRLYFDLIGLPPAPEVVDSFVADKSPQAYEKLVDSLFASEHYGERLAAYWLDVVRYADTAGYHSDNHRDLALYRDYVINAFNKNKPFDQFTIEQLAGDLIPNAVAEQRIASGYNRLLQTTEEGGAQAKEYAAKYAADRVRNTSVIWMGMTMGCCECHNHKYDPFTIRDFYSMEAIFADLAEKPVGRQEQATIPSSEQERQLAELDKKLASFREALVKSSPELEAERAKWEADTRAELAARPSDWTIAKPEKVESLGGTTLTLNEEDNSVLASGENPEKETYTITLRGDEGRITGFRLEALAHESLDKKSLSRGGGNFVLTEVEVDTLTAGDKKSKRVKIASAEADYSQAKYAINDAIDGKAETGWGVDGNTKVENRKAVFTFAQPIVQDPALSITIKLHHNSKFPKHNIGRFRLALTSAKPSLSDKAGIPDDVAKNLLIDSTQRTTAQKQALEKFHRTISKTLEPIRGQVTALEKEREALAKTFPQTLVSMAVAPRTIRVLARGNWLDDSGEVVEPNTPAVFGPLGVKDRRATRLDFGKWLTTADNPLTARVFVNRLWKLSFGQGIVKTLEDFGMQGEWPTHPELLDWLATEFRESGWNVKHIHKLMVMSHTYQLTSQADNKLREVDPYNRLLARQGRFRLEAEFVRDNALAISGLLVTKVGGKSVKPYQPAGYWANLNFPKREWENDKGEGLYRRALYTYWCRTFLHPALLAFDAPSREECVAERPRSNTPLQALVLLNDPTYVEAARVFATRVIREGGATEPARLTFAFRHALGRSPRDEEVKLLTDLHHKHQEQYAMDVESANELLKIGDMKTPNGVDPVELAAWTSVARVILNLHETITRN